MPRKIYKRKKKTLSPNEMRIIVRELQKVSIKTPLIEISPNGFKPIPEHQYV